MGHFGHGYTWVKYESVGSYVGQSWDILVIWAMNESTMGHVLVIHGSTVNSGSYMGHICHIWVNHGIYGSHGSQSNG